MTKKSEDTNEIIRTIATWILLFGLVAAAFYCYVIGKEDVAGGFAFVAFILGVNIL